MTQMNIYLLTRTDVADWDDFDGFVVCAESETDACNITHTDQASIAQNVEQRLSTPRAHPYTPECWEIKAIGIAHPSVERGIVLDSFKAG